MIEQRKADLIARVKDAMNFHLPQAITGSLKIIENANRLQASITAAETIEVLNALEHLVEMFESNPFADLDRFLEKE